MMKDTVMLQIRYALYILLMCSGFMNSYAQTFPYTGAMKVTGDFTTNTCKVSTRVNGANSSLTIIIPPVTDTDLNQGDGFSPLAASARTFSIAVSECQGNNYKVNVFFDVSSNLVDNRGHLKNTTSAGSNAVLQILNESNNPVLLTPVSNQGTSSSTYTNVQTGYEPRTVNTGEIAEFVFKVRYSRPETGNATPGRVTAVLPFYLNYQ